MKPFGTQRKNKLSTSFMKGYSSSSNSRKNIKILERPGYIYKDIPNKVKDHDDLRPKSVFKDPQNTILFV